MKEGQVESRVGKEEENVNVNMTMFEYKLYVKCHLYHPNI